MEPWQKGLEPANICVGQVSASRRLGIKKPTYPDEVFFFESRQRMGRIFIGCLHTCLDSALTARGFSVGRSVIVCCEHAGLKCKH